METIAPGFLIAAPALHDPNFDRTVVLMCVHNDEGALGLVINRPSPVRLSEIMEQLEISPFRADDRAALLGGPVAVENGLVLYEAASGSAPGDGELMVSETLRLCPNRELLGAIGRGRGPSRYELFLGHAGWGPGQLEQEISQGAWIPASLKLGLIFDTPMEQRWDEALRSEGLHPAPVAGFRPQA